MQHRKPNIELIFLASCALFMVISTYIATRSIMIHDKLVVSITHDAARDWAKHGADIQLLHTISKSSSGGTRRAWERHQMKSWAAELRNSNSNLDIPDPNNTPWYDSEQDRWLDGSGNITEGEDHDRFNR